MQTYAAFIHLVRELGEPKAVTDALALTLTAAMKAYHAQAPQKPVLLD